MPAAVAGKAPKRRREREAAGAPAAAPAVAASEAAEPAAKRARYTNKQRVLVFSSRGIVPRFRHLMTDLKALLPHSKAEVKLEIKGGLTQINEICEVKGCNNCVFFEVRKKRDLYLWLSRTPNGPSVKFEATNIHTMEELKLTGNCLLGSRPLLIFDDAFGSQPQWRVLREILNSVFATPNGHPKSKPFIDHALCFFLLDNRVWIRNYEILDSSTDEAEIAKNAKAGKETTSLVEIGPRVVLNVIRLFRGSFGGPTLYKNPNFFEESG